MESRIIVSLRVGARATKGKWGGEGKKKITPARYHCSFGKLCTPQTELQIGAA